jgi:hypothetical protein
MDDERLEELFRAYRDSEISEEEWVGETTSAERIRTVIRHGNLSEEEILTLEQLTVALEISDENTAPDDVDLVDPEDIGGRDDLDLSNTTSDESE